MAWESARSAEQRRIGCSDSGAGICNGNTNPLDCAETQDDMWQSLRAEMLQNDGDEGEDAADDNHTNLAQLSGDLTFPVLPSVSQVRKRTTAPDVRRTKASTVCKASGIRKTAPKHPPLSNPPKQQTLAHAFSDKEMESLFKQHHELQENDGDDKTTCADISRFLQDDDYDSEDASETDNLRVMGIGKDCFDVQGNFFDRASLPSGQTAETPPQNLFEILAQPHITHELTQKQLPIPHSTPPVNMQSASHSTTGLRGLTESSVKQAGHTAGHELAKPHGVARTTNCNVLVEPKKDVLDCSAVNNQSVAATTPDSRRPGARNVKPFARSTSGTGYVSPTQAEKGDELVIMPAAVTRHNLSSQQSTPLASQILVSPEKRTPVTNHNGALANNSSNRDVLTFFWIDARDQNHFMSTDPGSVFLFGRLLIEQPLPSSLSTESMGAAGSGSRAENGVANRSSFVYESCCIRVRQMYRCVYLLPCSGASESDVVKEVNELCRAQNIEQRRIKFVQRYYAFERAELPRERTTWVKLRYPAKYPPLQPHNTGSPPQKHTLRSIEAILGATTSLLELLLIKRKMKGPCFLRITQATPVKHRISHCVHEFTVESPKHVFVEQSWATATQPINPTGVRSPGNNSHAASARPAPLFNLVSIQLHTHLDSKGHSNEVYAVCVAQYNAVNIDASLPEVPHALHVGIREPRVSQDAKQRQPHQQHKQTNEHNNNDMSGQDSRLTDEADTLPLDLEVHCSAKGLTGVRRFHGERALLEWLSDCLRGIDADFVIGHNFLGFTLSTLLQRYEELGVRNWSALGRLDLKRLPNLHGQRLLGNDGAATGSSRNSSYTEREVCIGRLIVDSYTLAREYYKSVNYKLVALADQMQLRGILTSRTGTALVHTPQHQNDTYGEPANFLSPEVFSSSKKVLDEVLLPMCNYAVLAMNIVAHLDVIRLTRRLTNIAGNLWSRTLAGARSERIEYLLLHSFHHLKFITPDKRSYAGANKRARVVDGVGAGEDLHELVLNSSSNIEEGKRKSRYQGGMVLEPKCGLYSDYTLLLDFNSLYPSLIQEFNICFTTINWHNTNEEEQVSIPPPESLLCAACAAAGADDSTASVSPCLHRCVLPRVIRGLVESRREVKRLMQSEKSAAALALLDIRQKALKLTANSMYGCLGFEHSRFHAQPLAELVTQQGRLALQNTVDLIPQINPALRVIYGDTDSVMIQTGVKSDIAAVREMGINLKSKINKRYHNLEIDIDGIFRAILLLKKKKYAALSVRDWQNEGQCYVKEIKGLDMVRRDWCPLSKQVSDSVLNRVLNAEGSEDILDYIMSYMSDVAEHVRRGDRYRLDDFVISKSITKEPELYRGSGFPHATVALRMKQRKLLVRVGDLIPYVMCIPRKGNPSTTTTSDTNGNTSDKDSITNRLSSRHSSTQEQQAYHVDEVRRDSSLAVDVEWYLATQVYPPVMRLCEHIQGFSAVQLSEMMSLATSHTAGVLSHSNKIAQFNKPGGSGEGDAVLMHADSADSDAAGLFDHYNMFRNKDPTECFPSALPLQVVCPHCRIKVPIDPYERVREVIRSRHQQQQQQSHNTNIAETALLFFDLYVCNSCHRSLPVDYVANTFTQMSHDLVRQFYLSGGGASAVHRIRNQFTYFRALFDVPHAPGCSSLVRYYHRSLARRCLGIDRRLYTLEQAAQPAIAEAHDPVDPLSAVAETFYKRLEHMFINLGSIFKSIKSEMNESAAGNRAELVLAFTPGKDYNSSSK